MVDAAKAFLREPPRRPLVDLHAVVEDFQWRYVERKKTDQVIAYCRSAHTFEEAVARAVESRDAMGKHHNHQSKVDITARRLFGRRIINRKLSLRRAMDRAVWSQRFDVMHDLFDEIKPYGIGPVTVYDVAVRVGAFVKVEPQSVYLHAGVRQGLRALQPWLDAFDHDGYDFISEPSILRQGRIPINYFPSPLKQMKADDVEDILCTYRGVFVTWHG